jgi:hypothetical protein
MKAGSTPIVTPQGLRPPQAAAYIGCAKLLEEMDKAGWISPVIKRHKLTLYSRAHLDAAFERLLTGEIPTAAASA